MKYYIICKNIGLIDDCLEISTKLKIGDFVVLEVDDYIDTKVVKREFYPICNEWNFYCEPLDKKYHSVYKTKLKETTKLRILETSDRSTLKKGDIVTVRDSRMELDGTYSIVVRTKDKKRRFLQYRRGFRYEIYNEKEEL